MATEVIQKITIPKKEIQSVSANGEYYVRYRVISEGGSKSSDWSQIFTLTGNSLSSTSNTATQFVSTDAVSVSWNILNTLNISEYDVYVSYGTGSGLTGFEYYATVSANNIYIPKPATSPATTQMKVAIFARGSSKLDNTVLKNTQVPTPQPHPTTLVGSSISFLAETATFSI